MGRYYYAVAVMLALAGAPTPPPTAIGEPLPATPPPPTIVYLSPPVAVWTGEALYALEGVRPLWPARVVCAASPCAVREGMVVSTDGVVGVTVEARRGVALPWVGR